LREHRSHELNAEYAAHVLVRADGRHGDREGNQHMDPPARRGVKVMGPAAHGEMVDEMDLSGASDDMDMDEQWAQACVGARSKAAAAAAAAAVTTLGDLPSEVVAYVLKLAAPAVPIFAAVVRARGLDNFGNLEA